MGAKQLIKGLFKPASTDPAAGLKLALGIESEKLKLIKKNMDDALAALEAEMLKPEDPWWKTTPITLEPGQAFKIGQSFKQSFNTGWEGTAASNMQAPSLLISVRCVGRPILDHLGPNITEQLPTCFVDAVRISGRQMEEWEALKLKEASSVIPPEWLPPFIEKWVNVPIPLPSKALTEIPIFGSDDFWDWSQHHYRYHHLRLKFGLTDRRDREGLIIYQLVHDYPDY